jgi:hypothetical protein
MITNIFDLVSTLQQESQLRSSIGSTDIIVLDKQWQPKTPKSKHKSPVIIKIHPTARESTSKLHRSDRYYNPGIYSRGLKHKHSATSQRPGS